MNQTKLSKFKMKYDLRQFAQIKKFPIKIYQSNVISRVYNSGQRVNVVRKSAASLIAEIKGDQSSTKLLVDPGTTAIGTTGRLTNPGISMKGLQTGHLKSDPGTADRSLQTPGLRTGRCPGTTSIGTTGGLTNPGIPMKGLQTG